MELDEVECSCRCRDRPWRSHQVDFSTAALSSLLLSSFRDHPGTPARPSRPRPARARRSSWTDVDHRGRRCLAVVLAKLGTGDGALPRRLRVLRVSNPQLLFFEHFLGTISL